MTVILLADVLNRGYVGLLPREKVLLRSGFQMAIAKSITGKFTGANSTVTDELVSQRSAREHREATLQRFGFVEASHRQCVNRKAA